MLLGYYPMSFVGFLAMFCCLKVFVFWWKMEKKF